MLGFSLCGRPKLRAQNLRPLMPLYKRVRRIILFLLLLLPIFFTATEGRRKREQKKKRERRGEPPFLKLERKTQFFFIV